ncbi:MULTISPECIES: NAD(P)-dependent oxidoreductase [Giesbergeria]|uniref:NAD(P)-dependent oxidoreductase n=1 Tax=Giesbergeria sinuosa TaxID=80883 RepID=A0ABV9QF60_9BURK
MSRPRLTILNQLGTATTRAIATSGAQVQVLDDACVSPWQQTAHAEILLTAPRNGWREAPQQAPPGWPGRLRWVHTASAGVDFYPRWLLDVPQVSCSRGVAAAPIAEFVLHALLAHTKELGQRRVTDPQQWHDGFAQVHTTPLGLLQGQTLGLLGYGAIGQAIAVRAQALGMHVLALRQSAAPVGDAGVGTVRSLPELLALSDHLVLALPATAATYHIINAHTLAHARAGLHLVNIARGSLVDQTALLAALDAGRLSGATLDVTDPEPLPTGHLLYTHPRVRLTPHISWSASNAVAATAEKFVVNLHRYLHGQPLLDQVDPQRGY